MFRYIQEVLVVLWSGHVFPQHVDGNELEWCESGEDPHVHMVTARADAVPGTSNTVWNCFVKAIDMDGQ